VAKVAAAQACDTDVLDTWDADAISTSSLIEGSLKCILVSESQTVRLSRRSRTQQRLGVRIEESWPRLVAVLMVGGECSTESDSMRFRSSLVSKP
jgi:hypothetical protein